MALVLPAGCNGDGPSQQQRQSSYEVVKDSQSAAATVLATARTGFPAASGSEFFLTWRRQDKYAAMIRGAYYPQSSSAVQEIQVGAGNSVETRIVGSHVWSRPTVDGKVGTCWYRLETSADDPLEAGALPALTLPLGARAIGSLRGGRTGRIVAEISAAAATAAVMPKLANTVTVDPKARFDGVVTVADGQYRSVTFHYSDLIKALNQSGADLPSEMAALRGGDGGEVSVGYEEANGAGATPVSDDEECATSG